MSCVFIFTRFNLLGIMCMTLAVISLLRYLNEFHFKHYQNWQQETLFSLCSTCCILPIILANIAIFIRCDKICFFLEEASSSFFSNTPIVYKDICYLPQTVCFLAVAFTIILIFNILPICFFIYKNINILDNNIQTLPVQIFLISITVEPQEMSARENPRSFDHLHITDNTSPTHICHSQQDS